MKTFKTIAASAVMAAALMGAGAASAATIYNLNTYDSASGITGSSLGTVTVGGQGSNVLSFDVLLNSNVFFQMSGNGGIKDAFWFDLLNGGASFSGPVTFNITSPDGSAAGTGDYGTGGLFSSLTNVGKLGQGWAKNYDYAVEIQDSTKPIDYYTGHLTFTVTGANGTHLDLAPETFNLNGNSTTVLGAADLRQCPGADPTSGSCSTGPVGFALSQTSAVPEPATWAIMLMGFGGLGAMLRQRRQQVALVRA